MSKIVNEYQTEKSCIIAENRKSRPFIGEEKNKCPFCIGHEYMLENIWLEHDKGQRFNVRIVSNKYPLCHRDDELYGVHDVVIDTTSHVEDPKEFSVEHWQAIFLLMKERWVTLAEDDRIHFIQIFKNHGEKAGASIAHSHWQIVALEKVPYSMIKEYTYSEKACILCQYIEEIHRENIILVSEDWFIIAPNIPQMAYETWIVPKVHISNYGELTDKLIADLSQSISKLIKAYSVVKDDMAYNICVMSERPKQKDNYHFYIKIIPRENHLAGFELSTGCSISMIEPIKYARELASLVGGQI